MRNSLKSLIISSLVVCSFSHASVKRMEVDLHTKQQPNSTEGALPLIKFGVLKPQRPNGSIDSRTVEGIDENYNGVRDSAEREFYDLLLPSTRIKEGDFESFLSVASRLTAHEPVVERSIYQDLINCEYNNLPYYIQSRIPMSLLYEVMLNNSKRKIAFKESFVPAGQYNLKSDCSS
ncbi:hypothetical protein OH460_07920 [Vibrio sp. Makdt]|uniref:hypothetical protein n=1 Tax=Vibrio sp. Makdt TaxID=2998828 RepID=UPI0022CD99D7|nr:hypothetical protein [Vibrio sp. Makdt]MDA0152224.1 hypothetical protein [Vibrio sp. Makdt]